MTRAFAANAAAIPEKSPILLSDAAGTWPSPAAVFVDRGYRVPGPTRVPLILRQKTTLSTEVVSGDMFDRSCIHSAFGEADIDESIVRDAAEISILINGQQY